MESTDFLKMNVPGYSDAADILKVSENFEKLDDNLEGTAEKVADLERRLEKLEKTAPDIKVIGFTATPRIAEKGDVVSVELKWELSSEATKTTVNGIVVAGTEYTDTGVASDKAYSLYAEDERGKTASATAAVTFANRIYAGASSDPSATAEVIKRFPNNVVLPNKNRTVIIRANNEYVYYAYPKSLGTSVLKAGVLIGGFMDPVEMNIENSKGYTETYYIYRSDNKLTGTVEVTVE